jgi:hypothetical protein
MNLATILELELNHRTSSNLGVAQVVDGNVTLSLQILQIDPLGLAFEGLILESPRLANTPTKELTAVADQLAAKLTYLLEPLRVIEIDGTAGAVQMRSSQPSQRSDRSSYYELLVRRGGSIAFERYEKQPSLSRSVIPAILTREVLFRLVSDMQAAL